MENFLTVYPEKYEADEAARLDEYMKQLRQIDERGPVNIDDLVSGKISDDTPGIKAPVIALKNTLEAKANEVDPDNRLYFDERVAVKYGYDSAPAFPPMFAEKGGYFQSGISQLGGVNLGVSELNHSAEFLKPVYAGDTLFTVIDKQGVYDITPKEGSEKRSFACWGTASVYNQKGELVMKVNSGVVESLAHPTSSDVEVPKPRQPGVGVKRHVYTDEDWKKIISLWKNEKLRGDEILYWEDVNIGDRPPVTVDGPYTVPQPSLLTNSPSWNDWAVKKALICGDANLLDNANKVAMEKDEYGRIHIKSVEQAEIAAKPAMVPPAPKAGMENGKRKPPIPIVPGQAASFENYTSRDAAFRMLTNWIGYHGHVQKIAWCNGERQDIPNHPLRDRTFDKVPEMEGRYVDTHGIEGHLSINNAYVYNKYEKDGAYFADLAWWCQTIDDEIIEEGLATVRLPSKKG